MMNGIMGRVLSKVHQRDLARERSHTHRAQQMAWRQTDKGKAYCKRNRDSDASKESIAKHRKTDKWKATRERFLSRASNRISGAMSSRFHQILKGAKSLKSISYTGFATSEQLMDHLATMFEDGMTRENYGKKGWELDHCIPRILYDHEDEEEIFRCWNACNLRPCWASQNRAKGAKLVSLMIDRVPQEYWPKAWGGVCPM
tara:strand:- start:434 stop:1036 length:603 start_codon:yes stop_codon:yes gene_type:complete